MSCKRWLTLFGLCLAFMGCGGSYVVSTASDGDGGTGDGPVIPPGRHHPDGFAASTMHGPALKQQSEDCRACHGQDLTGGASGEPSCDGCHQAGWRTSCVYCHGGSDNQTGAPPRQLDGSTGLGGFAPHTAHVSRGIARAADCSECHVKAVDVLSPGHVFDDTHGQAETDLAGGLSAQGTFDRATGTCSNNYCHGSGRADDGQVLASDGARDCASCHPGMASTPAAKATMSGGHGNHLAVADITCGDCHAGTTSDGTSIADPDLHVDGQRQVAFATAGFSFDAAAQTCTGSCHGTDHSAFAWQLAGGRFHPAGWAQPAMHGPEMELQRMNCRSCHGATLQGGLNAQPSCDSCHQPGWRTNCVYCHGGQDSQTGAPPRDVGALAGGQGQSFVAHTRHLATTLTTGMDCTECHSKPSDVLSAGHAFDATVNGVAEVTFAGGRAGATSYAAGTCSNNYCHGNGRAANGRVTDGGPSMTCASCHPGMNSGGAAWDTMSGDHHRHLSLSGVTCGTCHDQVASSAGTAVISAAKHLDGARTVSFSEGTVVYSAATKKCTGSCHNKSHNDTW